MPLQWSWKDFQELYTNLHMDQVYKAKVNFDLGVLDPDTSKEFDKGMVAHVYVVAIFDFIKNNNMNNAVKEKLVKDLFEFAKQHDHLEKLHKQLKKMDDEEDDDKEERRQFRNLHSGGNPEIEKEAHEVLHQLHMRLEEHSEEQKHKKPNVG